jgi:DNA-binding FadR family transcriptional regulator
LGDIKRKAMESDTKQQGDIQAHLNIMQMSQSDMIQQINHLYTQLDRVMKDLAESKKKQLSHTTIIKQLAHHISQKNGGKHPNLIFTALLIVSLRSPAWGN